MQSRLITADRIHNGIQWLPVDSTLEIADDGTIVRIHQDSSVKAKAIHYSGVLLPAFVNVHCHLELSHLHGVIPRNSGLVSFLQQVTKTRASFSDSQKR